MPTWRNVAGLARREGARAVLLRAAARTLGVDDAGLRPLDADIERRYLVPSGRAVLGDVVDGNQVAIVVQPFAAGGGGQLAIQRLAADLSDAGRDVRIFVYDRWNEHCLDGQRNLIGIAGAEVARIDGSPLQAGTVVATAWPTAYVARALAPSSAATVYLVQDYEPLFYPAGATALLAEATYGFGFAGVTLGAWLAQRLSTDFGMSCGHFSFAADLSTYRVTSASRRSDVVFYARPATPRRAFELGIAALEELHARRPEVGIHLVSASDLPRHLRFPCHRSGVLAPAALNDVYNRCGGGLVLSATNLSLLPYELLAAGCTPVVNDSPQVRAVLEGAPAIRCRPDPTSLAEGLIAAVDASSDEHIRAAAASLPVAGWSNLADVLDRVLAQSGR